MMKNKIFSFLNIAGLALGMAVCLLLILILKDANDYDKFHPLSKRVFRINTETLRKDGSKEMYATSPYTVGAALASNYQGIATWTMFNSGMYKSITAGNRKLRVHMQFTGNDFFKVFGFTLKEGNTRTVLSEPNTMVLSEQLADKLFPGENVTGKTVEVEGAGPFKVTGVLYKFPGKTHLEFEALASFATIPTLEKDSLVRQTTNDWKNYLTNYSYILLKPGININAAEAALAEIEKSNYKNLLTASTNAGYHFTLQPLNSITPGPLLSNNMGKAMSSARLWAFGLLAFVILLSASFNYINLTIARASGRMKEIAVRKIAGSSRKHIFFQLVFESVINCLLALVIGYLLLQIIIPKFSSLTFINQAGISFKTGAFIISLFLAFAVVLGLVAGLFPATVLSRVQPLMLMQKMQNLKFFRHLGFRKTILIVQFIISLVFISLVNITYKQTGHVINLNFGSAQANIFNIPLQGIDYKKASGEFSKVPGVERISAVSSLMGSYSGESDRIYTDSMMEAIQVSQYFTDENYISNFNLQLVAGENFFTNDAQAEERYAIVNEKFASQFKLGNPAEAVGKIIYTGDSLKLIVRGVLKDFLFKPVTYALEPLLIRYKPEKLQVLNIAISPVNTIQTTAQLEVAWKKLTPYYQFQGKFYSQEVEDIYSANKEMVWMIAFIGFLGITIACLGLLGITIFIVESKSKEVSIRKVLGANSFSLFRMLVKPYTYIIAIAVAVALPLSFLLANKILQGINERISLGPGIFLPGVLLVIILAFLTISSQIAKAVFFNPVKSLQTE